MAVEPRKNSWEIVQEVYKSGWKVLWRGVGAYSVSVCIWVGVATIV